MRKSREKSKNFQPQKSYRFNFAFLKVKMLMNNYRFSTYLIFQNVYDHFQINIQFR